MHVHRNSSGDHGRRWQDRHGLERPSLRKNSGLSLDVQIQTSGRALSSSNTINHILLWYSSVV